MPLVMARQPNGLSPMVNVSGSD